MRIRIGFHSFCKVLNQFRKEEQDQTNQTSKETEITWHLSSTLHRDRFASFLSSGFTTMKVINPPEKKLANRTSVHCRISPSQSFSFNLIFLDSFEINKQGVALFTGFTPGTNFRDKVCQLGGLFKKLKPLGLLSLLGICKSIMNSILQRNPKRQKTH